MTVSWDDYKQWLVGVTSGSWVNPVSAAPHPSLIATDSRKIIEGQFYVALSGANFDGHAFINEAMEKGASFFLYNSDKRQLIAPQYLDRGIPVTNTLVALQNIATGWRRKVYPEHVFAMTGSVGKTTVKELLACICAADGDVVYPQGSFNNEVGVPLTILSVKSSKQKLILECGARHIGDIKFLCELAEPTIACVLNVKHVHIAEFGSIENVLKGKTEMFRDSPSTAILIAPSDDESILDLAKATGKKIISFGFNRHANVRVLHFKESADGTHIDLQTPRGALAVDLTQVHESLPFNTAAAVAMAIAANIPNESIKRGLKNFTGAKGRFQIEKTSAFTIVDDSYNASPESMQAGFATCAKLFPTQTKVAVLGDMLELGPESPQLHYDIGKKCFLTLKPDLLIAVGPESKEIARGAIEAGLSKEKVLVLEDVGQAQRLPERVYTKRDVIYVKGSRGMTLDKLVEALKAF